jgi:hypothetical protein
MNTGHTGLASRAIHRIKEASPQADISGMPPQNRPGSTSGTAQRQPVRSGRATGQPRPTGNSHRKADELKRLTQLQPKIIAALHTVGDRSGARNAEESLRRVMGELRSLRVENRRLHDIVGPLREQKDQLAARVLRLEREGKPAPTPVASPPTPRPRTARSIFTSDRYATEPHRE